MASVSRESVSAQIDRLFRDGTLTSLSDAQLLDRYLSVRDEAAFEALVNLHGPMVLGLCRRMLRDPRDIEDAFQATFLVLVKKVPRIRDRGLLSNWLYGVAYRVAFRARGNLLRRRDRETSLGEIDPPEKLGSDDREDVPPALDQELNRLPARYRSPLVLCYLKGLTHDQAAEALRCPVGTVRSRLARGRSLLKRRLTARGGVSASAIASLTTALPASAVPEPLIRATVEAAGKLLAAKGAVAGTAFTAAESLTEGGFQAVFAPRFKTIALSLLGLALITAGVVGVVAVAARRPGNAPLVANAQVLPPAKPGPDKTAISAPAKVKPGDYILVEVLEALPGRPISGIRLVRPDGTISLSFYGDVQVAGLDRNEIKVKVVNHLRKFLTDEALGLIGMEEGLDGFGRPALEVDPHARGVFKRVKPLDTDRVFVDESVGQYKEPDASEDRWRKAEEKLDSVMTRLDSLAQGKPAKDQARPEVGVSTRSPVAESNAGDPRKSELWIAYEKMRSGYPALDSPPSAETSPFVRPSPIAGDVTRLGALLATAERILMEREKKAPLGEVTQNDVDATRSTFEAAKSMIPEVAQKAREHLKTLRSPATFGKAASKESEFRARLGAAQSRFEEAKKRRQAGEISEEDYLDAEGDLQTLSNWLAQPKARSNQEAKFEFLEAELTLQFAEDLREKYLSRSQEARAGAAKPK